MLFRTTDRVDVAVVNPYGFPELQHLASALDSAGVRVAYFTALGFAPGGMMHRAVQRCPSARLQRILLKRLLPEGITAASVRRVAVPLEVVHQLVRLLTTWSPRGIMRVESFVFDRLVARRLARAGRPLLVVAAQGNALEVFTKAPRGSSRWLNYPIAHHHWMVRVLTDEASENPRWSRFLQGHDTSPRELRRLDAEIEVADRVLVGSSFVKRTFEAAGAADKEVAVVPLGAEHSPTTSPAPTEDRGLRVLFVGQLTQRKGLGYLLDAVAALPRGSVELRLVGPPVMDVMKIVEEYPGVEAIGAVPRSELADHFAWAEVSVLPSLAEGFPLSALEAMTHGVPVILTENTFASDLVEDGVDGFVVPARDARALAELLASLGERRDDLPALGENARQVASRYTWAAYRSRVVSEVSDHLIANRAPVQSPVRSA